MKIKAIFTRDLKDRGKEEELSWKDEKNDFMIFCDLLQNDICTRRRADGLGQRSFTFAIKFGSLLSKRTYETVNNRNIYIFFFFSEDAPQFKWQARVENSHKPDLLRWKGLVPSFRSGSIVWAFSFSILCLVLISCFSCQLMDHPRVPAFTKYFQFLSRWPKARWQKKCCRGVGLRIAKSSEERVESCISRLPFVQLQRKYRWRDKRCMIRLKLLFQHARYWLNILLFSDGYWRLKDKIYILCNRAPLCSIKALEASAEDFQKQKCSIEKRSIPPPFWLYFTCTKPLRCTSPLTLIHSRKLEFH